MQCYIYCRIYIYKISIDPLSYKLNAYQLSIQLKKNVFMKVFQDVFMKFFLNGLYTVQDLNNQWEDVCLLCVLFYYLSLK